MPFWSGLLCPALGLVLGHPTLGQVPPPRMVLQRLLTTSQVEEQWFTPAFLAQVPVSRLAAVLQQIEAQLGAYRQVEGDSSPFTVLFEHGTATAQIQLDADGRIAGLLFQNLAALVSDLGDALAGFRQLPGKVGVLVVTGGEDRAALGADQPLAVGSAFKLAILRALQEQIAAGKPLGRSGSTD